MAHVIDVASHILKETGNTSTMKLQKLVYYSQAYYLVKYRTPLFSQRIEAWVNGPVVPALYAAHRGQSVVSLGDVNFDRPPSGLAPAEKEAVLHVLAILGDRTGSELSELTHGERPWVDARRGLQPTERSNNLIPIESIQTYYSSSNCTNPLFR